MNMTFTYPLKVLLADDDKDDRFFFESALEQVPIQTELTVVRDGERLMAYLEKNSGNPPHVLFLDLNMPRKNGKECLAEIKNNTKIPAFPVVIYSTALNDEVADILYERGAHYYLQKCDFKDLGNCIAKILRMLIENPLQPERSKFILNSVTV
jgi:CheY-like chemotaxis protein